MLLFSRQPMHPHHFVAARVDHFDCCALLRTGREWQRNSPTQHGEFVLVDPAFQRPRQFVPRAFVGEECLRDAERPPVVICVQEPRRYL